MHYDPNIFEAFNSIEHIMRDVNNGWLVRYLHSNTASAFFFLVYLHIGRGIYYGSYKSPRTLVWAIGTVIFILMVGTGFLGFSKYGPIWDKYINLYNKKNYSRQVVYKLIDIRLTFTSHKVDNYKVDNYKVDYHKVGNHKVDNYKVDNYKVGNYNRGKCLNKRYYTTGRDFSNDISSIVQRFLQEKNLHPVFIYENLHSQETKKKINKDSNKISGVYLVLNKITGDYYIGSAPTNKIYSRFSRHLVNFTGSKIVKLATKKYGLANFAFIILELFPEEVNVKNNKKLLDLEDFYLKILLPNYNIITEAGSNFGYKHTEIARIQMKTEYNKERREATLGRKGYLNNGKILDEKTKATGINRALVRKEPCILPLSTKFLDSMKNNSKGIILYNISNMTVFGEFDSILEASKIVKCNDKTIKRALKTERKVLLRRWIVQFK